jgi:hypothetical protein
MLRDFRNQKLNPPLRTPGSNDVEPVPLAWTRYELTCKVPVLPYFLKMFPQRKALYIDLETALSSKVIAFITGDRPGLETQIAGDSYDKFVNHLDKIGVVPKISLFLYTRGGDTLAAWSIINLLRQFCDDLEIVIPSKAHSAGTLMCLGANRIIMTKQATLGPIDPSINHPLAPPIPGGQAGARASVSVEAVNGFLELVRSDLKINGEHLARIVAQLTEKIHPLVLGSVFRTKTQIQMLARKLLTNQVQDSGAVDKIISFLCSESGSHDYTIHRREARESLGLKVEKPSEPLYKTIKAVYDDFSAELELATRFDPNALLRGQPNVTYICKRALIESIGSGSYHYVSEGSIEEQKVTVPPGITQIAQTDRRSFEGWKHEAA